MKNKNALTVSVLRMLTASIHARRIEKRGSSLSSDLSDNEIIEITGKEIKKRKESSKMFIQGNRHDLAEKEDAERAVLELYMPPRATTGEIDEIISRAIASVHPSSAKDFGKVIGEAMKELSGKADAGEVGSKIKEKISSMFV